MRDHASKAPQSPYDRPILATPLRRFDSNALFNDAEEIFIVHAGQEYRLRITRSNKLILTK